MPMDESNNRTPKPPVISRITILSILLIVCGAILLYIFLYYNPTNLIYSYLESDANAYVFIILMALLPLLGLPISIFLVLVGMMFGIPGGIALTGIIMVFHLLATYYLVHSFVRPLLIRFLHDFHLHIPKLPPNGKKRLGFAFMILPGLPYSMKNYLLALAEMPFKPYMLISWSCHFILNIPFIILGRGVIRMDPKVLLMAAGLIIMGLAVQYYLRRKYKKFGMDMDN